MTTYENLPSDLPVPEDDGAADHLTGTAMPGLALTATDGQSVDLSALGEGRTVLYLYPLSGKPGTDLPHGWDAGVLFEETQKTLFCSDLFHQTGDVEGAPQKCALKATKLLAVHPHFGGVVDAIEIEPTRVYNVEDARAFLSGQGVDVGIIVP